MPWFHYTGVSVLLAPIVDRAQIISTGANYREHTEEAKDEIQVREPVFFPFLWAR